MIIRTLYCASRVAVPRRLPIPPCTSPRPCRFATTYSSQLSNQYRTYATKTTIDEKVEELQELYATAKDEFDIASEETEKKTVYAADDRAAAQEELAKLKEAYEKAVSEEGGDEVRRRVGHRLRELESAVKAMEERAMED
ncbi:hypothetical protein JMJ35_001264 [Cladonia borealis]|uniref:Uncharacterized protein n=1 Tax=Cladonia borealis TaxID=184061 RepID=A0AA39R9L5_9LECA|nr:hypothetical protein JMJ35_001264 [Cladonia borealis]